MTDGLPKIFFHNVFTYQPKIKISQNKSIDMTQCINY